MAIAVADLESGRAEAGALETQAPPAIVQQTEIELERFSFPEIRDRDRQELVTVLELLSPANKRRGKIGQQYLAKREQVLESAAHCIEIDLLRGGPRMPGRDMPACDYYALVSRVEGRPAAGIWPIGIRDRLPTIPVPLRHGDRDAQLDLQALLQQVYDEWDTRSTSTRIPPIRPCRRSMRSGRGSSRARRHEAEREPFAGSVIR